MMMMMMLMMQMILMSLLTLCNRRWMLDLTGWWMLIQRRTQTWMMLGKKHDSLQMWRRLVLSGALGGTLEPGTNFAAGGTL